MGAIAADIARQNWRVRDRCVSPNKEIRQDVGLQPLLFAVLHEGLSRQERCLARDRLNCQATFDEDLLELLDARKRDR